MTRSVIPEGFYRPPALRADRLGEGSTIVDSRLKRAGMTVL